jgi:SRSO17 transposase
MRWVVADSVYGGDSGIRLWLQEHKIAYVLAVTGQQSVWSEHGFCRMGKYVAELPESNWRRFSAGDGSKGPRLYDWFFKPLVMLDEGWGRAMLARRSISQPKEMAYYLVHMPLTAKVEEIIRVAGSRWSIESLFEAAKNEVGLDQYEVRSWNGWHCHMTLSMFAYAYLATIRKNANEEKNAASSRGMLPFTVPEVRRLIWKLTWSSVSDHRAVLSWSDWRRAHQYRAQRAHWQARLQLQTKLQL